MENEFQSQPQETLFWPLTRLMFPNVNLKKQLIAA